MTDTTPNKETPPAVSFVGLTKMLMLIAEKPICVIGAEIVIEPCLPLGIDNILPKSLPGGILP